MYKIQALKNMRFAESYNRWKGSQDDIKYYKLKYAAQLGEDVERLAFNYYENEGLRKNGNLNGVLNKSEKESLSNRPYY